MAKKLTAVILLSLLSVLAFGQYKVSSVESAFSSEFELKYFLETETSTIVYGTVTSSRTMHKCLYPNTAVVQNGVSYKIRNSVNLPVYDEAEYQDLYMREAGEKVNFVLEFPRFSLEQPFDVIETDTPKQNGVYVNRTGIRLEKIDLSAFPDFDAFLDSYPATIYGSYKDNGVNVIYYMRDNVYVSCRATDVDDGFLEPKYKRFEVEISNDSDHGILFDFDKTSVIGHRTVGGNQQDKPFVRYMPDSFEQYLADSDYYEAKNAVGGMAKVGDKLRSESYNSNNSEWANLGLKVLGDMANNMAEQNIREYLAAHPKNRPGVLRSQSMKSGTYISGYMAYKTQKADSYTLHIPLDGYDFTFEWK